MKSTFPLYAVVALLASTTFAQTPIPPQSQPDAKVVADDVVKNATKRDSLAELLQSGSDPFRLSDNEASSAAALMDLNQLALDVQMKGVLKLKDREAVALISIGKGVPTQLVAKDDLIVIPQKQTSSAILKKQKTNNLYLIVKEITSDAVVVSPQQRPQEQMTIR